MHYTHVHTARFSFLYTGINLHVEQCPKNLMQTLGEICRGFELFISIYKKNNFYKNSVSHMSHMLGWLDRKVF